ncbi:hypothetical protein VPNG_02532 [Cytospora leucostoma]|uniref:Uncharacterized protein n=1 Tax=Cytospora leucostoma TaxID=1230097 RepID=A0A423XHT6_9PEZI|nr:hypothetical protein VPNG_02532 [Cytospora leucostoma]
MIDFSLLYTCFTQENQQRILNFLYHWYLKTRSDVYLRVDSRTLALDNWGWGLALRWNLFREYEGQSLLVPLEDVNTLCRCLALCHASTARGHGNSWEEIALLVEWDLKDLERKYEGDRLLRMFGRGFNTGQSVWRRADRHAQPALQTFVLHIADFLMETHGIAEAGSGRGEEILGPEGRLREDNPIVEHFQFRLPRFHPVCVFEVPARSIP